PPRGVLPAGPIGTRGAPPPPPRGGSPPRQRDRRPQQPPASPAGAARCDVDDLDLVPFRRGSKARLGHPEWLPRPPAILSGHGHHGCPPPRLGPPVAPGSRPGSAAPCPRRHPPGPTCCAAPAPPPPAACVPPPHPSRACPSL